VPSFDDRFDSRLPYTHSLVRTIRLLGEYRGKEELYAQQMPQALETLRQAAVIQSTASSNRIEGVVAPAQRIRDLVAEKTTPRDRSEQEIAGYRDVLATIHANHEGIRLSPNVVLQLHRDLFQYTPSGGGTWKNAPNTIMEHHPDGTELVRFEPLAPHLVDEAMRQLHEGYEESRNREAIDPLLLIPAYVLDFLCIHPFRDGNGRMARLITLLLLYQSGYAVGRYISLEKLVEETKESYYDTLGKSSAGWHAGTHTLLPWTEYLLGVILAAYRRLEERVGSLTTARGAKSQMVLDTIAAFSGDFSTAEIQERCPNVSLDLIRRILQEQKKLGAVEPLGRGPQARWRKFVSRAE
jgi:Fic family protein